MKYKYNVFQCEARDLENELNQRDPLGTANVISIHFFGTGVHVVLKSLVK